MDVERLARAEPLRATIAVTTTLSLVAAAIATVAGEARLFLVCFGVAALGVASYGLGWIVTGEAETKYLVI